MCLKTTGVRPLSLLVFVTVFFFTVFRGYSQSTIHYGLNGLYNISTKSMGVGLRMHFPVTDNLELLPQIAYFPDSSLFANNKIHDLYAGLFANYSLYNSPKGYGKYKADRIKFRVYLQGGVQYNRWFNYSAGTLSKLKRNNLIPEVGLGASYGNVIYRAFTEATFNIIGKETLVKAGVVISPWGLKQQNLLMPNKGRKRLFGK